MKIISNDQIAYARNSCCNAHELVNLQINTLEKHIPVCEDEGAKKLMSENHMWALGCKSGFNMAIDIINKEFKLDLPKIEI